MFQEVFPIKMIWNVLLYTHSKQILMSFNSYRASQLTFIFSYSEQVLFFEATIVLDVDSRSLCFFCISFFDLRSLLVASWCFVILRLCMHMEIGQTCGTIQIWWFLFYLWSKILPAFKFKYELEWCLFIVFGSVNIEPAWC